MRKTLKDTYITSDLHFYHKNIMKYCPARGEKFNNDVDTMNTYLLLKINELPENATLWHLGDFCFSNNDNIYYTLAKIREDITVNMIHGNHDNKIRKQQESIAEAIPNINFFGDYFEENIEGKHFIMFHYPIASFNGMYKDAVHFYGHCHGNFQHPCNRAFDVGIDANDLQIRNFEYYINNIVINEGEK